MTLLPPGLANQLWYLTCLPESWRFRRALTCLEETQAGLLTIYLRRNQNTEYGRRYGFAALTSVAAYQETVPLTTFDDYGESVERIGRRHSGVLTAASVNMFELSSGSTTASKLIPYTVTLKAEFQRAIAPWIVDLYAHYPQLKDGPSYWSITPLTEGCRTTPGGVPIGFEEDSAYLGRVGQGLVESVMAVPNAVKYVRDVETFRYLTLFFLLRQPHLRLISVWNPTFLSLLLESLAGWWDRLLRDIAHGTLTPPGDLDLAMRRALSRTLRPDKHRAQQLSSINPVNYCAIWPDLVLISCWADGAAAGYARRLAGQFPGVQIQGKGLLATEACVSFPLIETGGSVLAATSHFFEFLPVEAGGAPLVDQPKLAHQLEMGQTYTVVVTTGGGFYRYQLRDTVKVVGYVEQVPCLQFLGKVDQVSDWFGEKLDEQFVAGALDEIFRRRQIAPAFAMLAPDDDAQGFRYTLYLELSEGQGGVANMADELDQLLGRNFHYAYCRKLGQLAAPGVVLLSGGAAEVYLRACQARGQKLGNIKPAALHSAAAWRRWFAPLMPPGGPAL